MLTLNVPCISESYNETKIKLNFYFHTSLWCLERSVKKKNFNVIFSLCPGLGQEGLSITQRSVKIKILFYFFALSRIGTVRVKHHTKKC